MSTSRLRPGPLDELEQAFDLLCRGPRQPAVNGRLFGPPMPQRLVTAGELRGLMPRLPRTVQDAVWTELVNRARSRGPTWIVVAAGLALPGLRTAAQRVTRGFTGDRDDLDADLLCAWVEALNSLDIVQPAVCGRLRESAYRAAMRSRYAHDQYAMRNRGAPDESVTGHAPPRPWGHPDLVLADGIAQEVITQAEAELIAATRLEGHSLKRVAARLDVPASAARERREDAEQRLARAIIAGHVGVRMGYSEP